MMHHNFFVRFSISLYLLAFAVPVSLNAHSGFLSGYSTGELFILFIHVASLLLLILSLLARIFVKGNFFIFLSISGLLFSYWVMFLIGVKKDFTPRIAHSFQEADTYGAYKGDDKPYYGDGKNILDMHFNGMAPSILDDNKTIYENILTGYARKTYIDALKSVESFLPGGGDLYAFGDKNKRNPFVIYEPYGHWQVNNKKLVFDPKSTESYTKRYNERPNEFYRYRDRYENIDINDTEAIKRIPYDKIALLIDKPHKSLIFYKDKKFYKPFLLPYTPKLAVYDSQRDTVYVVYQEKKGVYKLTNTKTEQYEEIQRLVRYIVNQSILPFWKNPNVDSQHVTKKQLKTLRKVLLVSDALWHYYEVDSILGGTASVVVTTRESSDPEIWFILSKGKQWVVDKIIYTDRKEMRILGSSTRQFDEQ